MIRDGHYLESVHKLTFSKKGVIPAPYQVRGKLQPESSVSRALWMPPYQVRDRLLKSGMTNELNL